MKKKASKQTKNTQQTSNGKHTRLHPSLPSIVPIIFLCRRRPSRVVATFLAIFVRSTDLPSPFSVFIISCPSGGLPLFFFCFFSWSNLRFAFANSISHCIFNAARVLESLPRKNFENILPCLSTGYFQTKFEQKFRI